MRTRVPKQLRQVGLGDLAEGLTFNKLGRLNLLLRLQERFGEGFMENESARRAISVFDEALGKDEQEEQEGLARANANGQRTLDELLRMSRRVP